MRRDAKLALIASTWITRIALMKPISGPIETSMPPRPPRMAGVEASAAPISGAARPINAPPHERRREAAPG